jgi:Kef-type K+ transport system membrane component KefB
MPSVLCAAADVHVEQVLLTVLIQLVVIILAARLFAGLFRCIKQPAAVGEIAAGIVLGPSVLGWLAPELTAQVFDPAVRPILQILSQLGLILLLFLVGLEFDFTHLRWHGKAALAISLTGIALPYALGLGLGWALYPHLEPGVNRMGFLLFMGIALSITALPVLARIMMELNITRTRLAAITIAAAAVNDACGWIILAAVASSVQAAFEPWRTVRMIATTVLFFLVLVFLVRPLLRRWVRSTLRRGDGELGLTGLAILLLILFLCAIATNLIGIFAIFGAFLLGAVLSAEQDLRVAVSRQLRNFVTAFFLPIFFTYTGLQTNIGTLVSPTQWLFCGLVCLMAIAGKFGGCGLAAWWGGLPAREAICVGAMMNTRGLMELVVINLGKSLGVITDSVYCMLVLMALLTNFMTTPVLLWFMRGTELEPYVQRSGFVAPRGVEAAQARQATSS